MLKTYADQKEEAYAMFLEQQRAKDANLTVSETGAERFNGKKNKLDLIPPKPIEDIGWVLTHGSKKYSDHNWRKGFNWTDVMASCKRHISSWEQGEDLDPESKLHHLAHAACNLLFLLEFYHENLGKDTRWKNEPKRTDV